METLYSFYLGFNGIVYYKHSLMWKHYKGVTYLTKLVSFNILLYILPILSLCLGTHTCTHTHIHTCTLTPVFALHRVKIVFRQETK